MEPSGKKKKIQKEDWKEDRLSNLNDGLIHHIFSFMSPQDAIRCSVLSKRWFDIWKSLPFLNFDFQSFSPPNEGDGEQPKNWIFSLFVLRFLLLRGPTPLQKVRLDIPGQEYALATPMLIHYAVEHKVEELEVIRRDSAKPVRLPLNFLTCESLTKVRLNRGVALPKRLSLTSLKIFHLEGFHMKDGEFYPHVIAKCPMLQTLKFVDVSFGKNLRRFSINDTNLKNLEFSFSKKVSRRCKVVITTPRLTSFQYDGPGPMVCATQNLALLDKALFDLKWNPNEAKRMQVLGLINMLKEFPQAKSLTLSWGTVKALSRFPALLDHENQQPFFSIKYLKINLAKWQGNDEVHIPGCVLSFFFDRITSFKLSV